MSVYRVIDVIGTSTQSWEDAAATAVRTARETLRDLRVAEVVEQASAASLCQLCGCPVRSRWVTFGMRFRSCVISALGN
jgi:flavin-binding protein dodecin